MSEKILVTGFDRFGPRRRPNRSNELALPAIKKKYGNLVETLVLPTARTIAAKQLIGVIKEIQPAVVVMFGISAGAKVRLEQRARNYQFNLLLPDNAGQRAIGRIDPAGPKQYDSTLPLDAIYQKLQAAAVPSRMSQDAGTFICNEVMYRALQHTAEQPDGSIIPTGFIHFGNGLSDQLIEEAAQLVIDGVVSATGSN